MRHILITLLLLLQTGCTFKNSQHMSEMEEEARQNAPHDGAIHKDIVYKSTLFHTLTLDIYEPLECKSEKAPIYFYIHGGSWLHGDKELVNVYQKTVHTLREQGIAVVSIDYRYISQSGVDAMISDCKDALIYVQHHAKEYGLDEHFIGLHGHSAGANLALVIGLTLSKQNGDIHFIVDEYGPTDVVKLLKNNNNSPWWTFAIPDASMKDLSPIDMLHSNLPSIYIVHGDADKKVPIDQSLAFYKRLKDQDSEVTLTVIPGADHSYRGASSEQVNKIRSDVLAYMLAAYAGE